MITDLYTMMLWMAVVWPLLLSIPALHSRLPWPPHLAILPAALLALLPDDALLELPWLLFGTGLAIDTDIRWILLMCVVIWFTAATVAAPARGDPAHQQTTTLFLLTLSGNLGAILTTDLVGFFGFSTLMGYGLYGLLINDGDKAVRRAGRLYLISLILADLALFEALLLAATATDDYRYEMVRQAMTDNSMSLIYLCMVLLGFALKAAIWPLHLWLFATFRSAPLSKTLLLGGVPVAMGLLGAIRWLPLGAEGSYLPGIITQLVGVSALLYVGIRLFRDAPLKLLPALATILASGLFIMALGMGLTQPSLSMQFEHLGYPFIAILGILLTAINLIVKRWQERRPQTGTEIPQDSTLNLQSVRVMNAFQQWASRGFREYQSHWHSLWRQAVAKSRGILYWQISEFFVTGWRFRITMLVLLGLVLVWLAA
jgi:multicomponent K+:H+ antiporter subunit D